MQDLTGRGREKENRNSLKCKAFSNNQLVNGNHINSHDGQLNVSTLLFLIFEFLNSDILLEWAGLFINEWILRNQCQIIRTKL
jgi:hypothetical protein